MKREKVNKNAVYVSFSHKDSDKANMILNELKALNINYWIDDHIDPGETWLDIIEDALNEASIFILLMSPDFIASEWSMYEMGHAVNAFKNTGAILIPIIIRHVAIPGFVKNINYIDATSMSPKDIAESIRLIIEHNAA